MNITLFNKMSNDEKLQYIDNLEERCWQLDMACSQLNGHIELLEAVISSTKALNERNNQRHRVNSKYDEHMDYLRNKYLPEDKACTCGEEPCKIDMKNLYAK